MSTTKKLGPLDYIAVTALSTVAGWAYACSRGPRSALLSTGLLTTLCGALYLAAPARKFPTGAQITEGVNLEGQVALVTGATSGIGVETARVLAVRKARVYLAARNERKLAATKKALLQAHPSLQIEILVCDLSDLESVRSCANAFLQRESRLDILINNAGIMAVPTRQETQQGLESQVGVCHVGHFYLTKLLLPTLLTTAESSSSSSSSRIVCLSSSAHAYHDFTHCLADAQLETLPYQEWTAYGNAKVANLLHAKALADKYSHNNNNNNNSKGLLRAYSVMPGGILTGLQTHVGWWTWLKYQIAAPLFFKTIAQGAATSLYCATTTNNNTLADANSSNNKGPVVGEYHDNCRAVPAVLAKVLAQVGADAPQRTWDATEDLLQRLGFCK